MTSNKIGKIIIFHRKKSKLTQRQLADLAGVGKTVVFDIEKGKETVQLNSSNLK
jgi:HTH-type transcriptional regulator / antitoxin HipB